jgi:zinc protease
VVEAFRDVIDEVIDEGFTADEMEAAKRGWLDRQQNGRANDGSVAGELSSQLYLDRTYDFTAEREEAVRALTIDEVNGAFRRYVDPDAISVFRAGDFAGAGEAPTS